MRDPTAVIIQTWDKMESVYDSVEDIDPFTGGVAEEPVAGGVVGPTFACIISKQFENIMKGDRFFFTHKDGGVRDLKSMIRKRRLSDIMCDNIPIGELPYSVFNISSQTFPCSENNKLNFHKSGRIFIFVLVGLSL